MTFDTKFTTKGTTQVDVEIAMSAEELILHLAESLNIPGKFVSRSIPGVRIELDSFDKKIRVYVDTSYHGSPSWELADSYKLDEFQFEVLKRLREIRTLVEEKQLKEYIDTATKKGE